MHTIQLIQAKQKNPNLDKNDFIMKMQSEK